HRPPHSAKEHRGANIKGDAHRGWNLTGRSDVRHAHPGQCPRQYGSQDGADEKIGPPPPEARPRMVGGVADDGLYDETGEWRRDPEDRDLPQVRAECLEDPADVGVLQRERELDAEEADTHVPDLPEGQLGFRGHGAFLRAASGAIRSAPMRARLRGPVAPPLAIGRRCAALFPAAPFRPALAGGAGGGGPV